MTDLPTLEQKLRASLLRPTAIAELENLLFPQVIGYDDVKLGMMCMLANPYDSQRRDRIHILLYGKHGTGKTFIMEPLEKNWGALYISMDPSAASLKGDARRSDLGINILSRMDSGIICIDDFELMKDMNALRDIMEIGRYSNTKGGGHDEFTSRVRFVCATNDIKKIPIPIINRFDLIYFYDMPTINQSMATLDKMLSEPSIEINADPLLTHYYYLVQTHNPSTIQKKKIKELFKNHLKKHGKFPNEGREQRWIASVLRIAKSLAQLFLTDIGPTQISQALEMKHNSERVLDR